MLKVKSDYLNIRYVASIFFFFFFLLVSPFSRFQLNVLRGSLVIKDMYSSVGLCNQIYNMGEKLESDMKGMIT